MSPEYYSWYSIETPQIGVNWVATQIPAVKKAVDTVHERCIIPHFRGIGAWLAAFTSFLWHLKASRLLLRKRPEREMVGCKVSS